MIYFDELIDIISEYVKDSQNNVQLFETAIKELEHDGAIPVSVKTLYTANAIQSKQLNLALRLVRLLAEDVRTITNAITKLPDNQDFSAVKKEVTSIRTVVDDVIIPLKKAIGESKARDIRGDEVYS